MTKNVTVYNTLGNNQTSVQTMATTWGELQHDLSLRGVSFSGMTAVVGETQVTLESSQAQLPDSNFRLFLMPQKVKSGSFNDEWLIDWENGISWDSVDWTEYDSVPEEYKFKTKKDLAIARAKKAVGYLEEVIEYLCTEEDKKPSDPQVENLQKTAEEIKRNMGLYD